MYTWGYIKENILSKLNLSESEANEQNFLSRFPFYANEAMTQICSAIKPNRKVYEIEITELNVDTVIVLPDDFVAFDDDVAYYYNEDLTEWEEARDEYLHYQGYNEVICNALGSYRIPYKARWFLFTKTLANATIITAPNDILDAIPSYIASQCLKIDDEQKSSIFRNEYEMFLSRLDDTTFKAQRTFSIGGNW